MKKWLLLKIFVFVMLLPLISGVAMAAESESKAACETWDIIATVNGTDIKTTVVNNERYLFLPGSANMNRLSLRFESLEHDADTVVWRGNKGQTKAEDIISVNAVANKDEASRYTMEAITKEGAQFPFYVMQGSKIRTLYLHSDYAGNRRSWVDSSKKNETTGDMELVSADGEIIYEGPLTQIKARGNSTFKNHPKKAYQIKLEKKADLLGTGEKVKTWVLLANYGDATLMHDKLFKDLAGDLVMDYTTSCDWINLYYDGEYRGVYLLSEKVSVGSAAVDITDMEETYEELNEGYGDNMVTAEDMNSYGQKYQYTVGITEPENVTGGYLIELNNTYIDEASGFFTAQGQAFNVKSPEWAGQEAMEYISEYYQEFENAVFSTDNNGNYTGFNAKTGKYYYEYCDLDSLVQTYLIQQLGLNVDAFRASFFFYKDVDDIMYAGPVWDMDNTCGTGWLEEIPYDWEFVDLLYLGKALSKIPHFRYAVQQYYTTRFEPVVEKLLAKDGTIDDYIAILSPSAAMNYQLWPYVRIGDPDAEGHLWKEGTDYKTVTEDLRSWLSARLAILNERFDIEDENIFEDVAQTDWEYEAVCYVTSKGIFNGITGEQFNPDEMATRGMMLTILARLEGQDTTPDEGERYDLPGVNWAVANGISDGTNPDKPITRQQLAVMLYRYAGEPESDGNLNGFKDGSMVSGYAIDAMKWAVSEGIFRGNGEGMLNPTGTATRAHIAQVMMNYMES